MAERHSRLGASASKRWLACPGSVALCDKLPKLPDTNFSIEGKAAHKLAELCLPNAHEPDDFIGRFIEVAADQVGAKPHRVEVTPEMAEAVTVYVDFAREKLGNASEHMIEQQFHLAAWDPEFYGRNDLGTYEPADCKVIVGDYKHGAGVPVEVKDNTQLRYYGLAAMEHFQAMGLPVHSVEIAVVQPRVDHADGPVRSHTYDALEIVEFGMELRSGAKAARSADAPLVDGKHCQFCPAAGMCPKLHSYAEEASELEQHDNQVAAFGNGLEPDELGKRLQLAERLRPWLKAVKGYAYAEATRGRVPDGFKLVPKRQHRKFSDPLVAMKEAATEFSVNPDDLFKKKPVSPAQLEKLVGKKTAAKFIDERLSAVKGLSLVAISDKRDAIDPNQLNEFSDLMSEDEE